MNASPSPASTRDIGLLIVANALLAGYFAVAHGLIAFHRPDWPVFLRYEGDYPFQLRILCFWLGKVLFAWLGEIPTQPAIKHYYAVVDFVSTGVASACLARLLWRQAAPLSTVSLGLAVFWWQVYFTYIISVGDNQFFPYDTPSIAFISLGLVLIERGPIWMLLILMPVATANRETAVLLAGFFLAWEWTQPGRRGRLMTLVLTAILTVEWVVTKTAISVALHAPPELLVSWYQRPGVLRFVNNFAFLHPRSVSDWYTWNWVTAFGLAWVPLLSSRCRWTQGMAGYLAMLVPFVAGMSLVGNLYEIRIYGEFIPVMALVLARGFLPRGDVGETSTPLG